jgi:exodeoxyribonuclease X
VKKIRVLDFESTGDSPANGHGLCEIGYCDLEAGNLDFDGRPFDWKVIGGKGRLCNPGCSIPPETQAIHHIDDEDVRDEPNWKPLLAGLLKRAFEDDVIAYAAYGADMELLWMHPDWLGVAPPPMLDIYKVGLRVWGEKPPHHSNRALQYWRRPNGLNRQDALPNHRAYPDALATAYLLRDLLNDEGTSIAQMVEWSALPALTVKCYLGEYRNDGKGTPWSEVKSDYLDWIVNKAGFHDKPDIRYTAEFHLEKRMMDQRLESERRALDSQLRANGLPEGEIDDASPPPAAPDPNQMSLSL